MAAPQAKAEQTAKDLVPLVVLSRGEQVLRKEYPTEKFSFGSSEKANLQLKASGVPLLHPLLIPNKKSLFVYVREGMEGELLKQDRRINLTDLLSMGVLPVKDGLHAITLEPRMQLSLTFGEHKLTIGFAPRPPPVVAEAAPVKPARIPVRPARPRLKLAPTFKFVQIEAEGTSQRTFALSFFLTLAFYLAVLSLLKFSIRYVPPRDVIAEAPPTRIAKLIVPEEKKPEPVLDEPETKVEDKPEDKPDEKQAKPPPSAEQQREVAKKQARKIGLVAVLASSGGGMARNIQAVSASLSDVLGNRLTSNADEGDATLKGVDAFGDSGGVDGSLDGLKRIKGRNLKASRDSIENPTVAGEAAGDQRRSYGAIAARMRQYMAGLRIVYKRLLREHPSAEGKISFKFTIKADGTVSNVQSASSSFRAYPTFEKDLADRISKIIFDPIPKGDVTVEFPFIFTPAS